MRRSVSALVLCCAAVQPGCFVKQPDQGSYFGLDEHKKNFFALGSYNSSANDETPLGEIEDFEWNFQLSLRRDLSEIGDNGRLTFAYTNRTFWQITGPSALIRTTDNQPELFYEFDFRDKKQLESPEFFGWHLRLGVAHQSNGEDGTVSRSWNRVFTELVCNSNNWEKPVTDGRSGAWRLQVRPWYVFNKDTENNPEVNKYFGNFELSGDFAWGGSKDERWIASAMLRNNLRRSGNRGAIELTVSRGFCHGWRIFAQYFNGYGESLIDYDDSSNRISVGVEFSRAR